MDEEFAFLLIMRRIYVGGVCYFADKKKKKRSINYLVAQGPVLSFII